MKNAMLFICMFLAGCGMSVPHNLRQPAGDNSSILAIAINKKNPTSIFRGSDQNVFFIKLNENPKNLGDGTIIHSNFYRDEYILLIDAEPGKYAAVASYSLDGERSYRTLFDRVLIKATITDVEPGKITFMGTFTLNTKGSVFRSPLKDAEQKYFFKATKNDIPLRGFTYSGTLKSADKKNESETIFLKEIYSAFRKTGWKKIIENRMKELDIKQNETTDAPGENMQEKSEELPPL